MKRIFFVFLLIFSLLIINGKEYECEAKGDLFNEVERYIKNLDEDSIFKLFCSICDSNDLNLHTKEQLLTLAKKLVDLERRKWNGIWARILANFLTTANMGKFD